LTAVQVLVVGRGREADTRILSTAGLEVAAVPTCLDALVEIARGSGGVVVLSARGIEGRETEAIRAIKDFPHHPDVLLTLPSRPAADATEASAAGADELMPEPYFPEDLLERVQSLLARRVERRADASPSVSPRLGSDLLAGLISDIGALNRAAADLDQLVDVVLEIFQRRTGARRASLLLHDRREDELVIRKAVGLPEGVPVATRIAVGQGISGRAAELRRPILVKDLSTDPHRSFANRGQYRTSSFLSLPLVARELLVGVLNLADKPGSRCFDEQDLTELSALAEQAAVSLENALRLRRMTALSIIDDLTGLYNRRHFRRSLEREFRRAVRYQRPLTLAILDLDHFKIYNDLNGHEAGNRALQSIGDILKKSFRNSDITARYGGEEFAVILPETEKGQTLVPEAQDGEFGAFRFLERLRSRIQDARFENEEALPGGRLTISGGVASYPTDASTVEELLESADRSLYLAKAEGRNRVHIA